jgi:hypothetical protein
MFRLFADHMTYSEFRSLCSPRLEMDAAQQSEPDARLYRRSVPAPLFTPFPAGIWK